jgi:hypothetical protein
VWVKYLDEDPVRITLADDEMLINDLKLSFISLLNSPLSSASPGSIRISLNSTVIPSNKAVSDFIDQISYEIPFLVSVQSIGIHEENSGISAPTATEKTDMTKSVPISEKGNSDGKAPLFSFNFSQAPTPSIGKSSPKFTSHQTRYSFKAKELFDFGVTEITKASIPELKSTVAFWWIFQRTFKFHS